MLDNIGSFVPLRSAAPREGAYVHGMYMEGARWDIQSGIIMESRLKELFPPMPVINVRVSADNFFLCPSFFHSLMIGASCVIDTFLPKITHSIHLCSCRR